MVVTTSDGARVKVHPRHEWVVMDRYKHGHPWITIETGEMLRRGLDNNKVGRGHRYNFMLPPVAPLQGEEHALPVDPYVLGAWLGDGTCDKPCVCEGAQDTGVITYNYIGLRDALRKNKHIPEEYLTASLDQRLALLAGLIDTDGCLRRREHRYCFSTTNEALRDDFVSLIKTFGWRTCVTSTDAKLSSSGVQGRKTVWQIAFNPSMEIPCIVPRKQLKTFSKPRMTSIISIERCDPEPGQCITVEGGVYLTGKLLTPTHNSHTITETLPSWYLGKHPDGNVIIAGYESTFAESFSRRNRDKFNEYATDVFRVEANDKVQGVALWETADGGRCRAAGLKAGITGFGADLFIIDDPIKNQEAAESETVIAKIHDEMGPSVQSRIHPGGKLIVIQTRWVENDVIGYVEKNWSEYVWKNINLPCECEDPANDPLGRALGDSLMGDHLGDPPLPQRIRNDNAWLKSKKMLVCAGEGEHVWNALYQGHPSAQNGNLFRSEWWQLYSRKDYSVRDFEFLVLSVDATFKKTDTSDMVAIELWGLAQNHCYLYKLINKRMGFVETVQKIKDLVKDFPEIDQLLIEDKANGSAIIDTLRYIDGVPPIVGVVPMGGKYSRAQAVSPFVATLAVHVPSDFTEEESREIEWDGQEKLPAHQRFITQHSHFPFAKHDDMVDAETQCLQRLIKMITGEEPVPERKYLRFVKWYPDMWEDFDQMSDLEQDRFIKTYGAPLEWQNI